MKPLDAKTSPGATLVAGQAARFAVVGVVNTALTGALFYFLAYVMPVWLAYSISFAAGLVFAATVSPRLVFQARPSGSRRAAYAAWYLLVFLLGLACVRVLNDLVRVDHLQVVVLTLVVTASLGFVGGRVILTSHPHGERN
jgi:putative flippase GtrA